MMMRARPRRHVTVGIGTTLGAITALAPVIGGGQYNLPFEVSAMVKGEKSMGELPGMIAANVQAGLPMIVGGIAIPAIGKMLLGGRNPTVFRGRRFIVKGL